MRSSSSSAWWVKTASTISPDGQRENRLERAISRPGCRVPVLECWAAIATKSATFSVNSARSSATAAVQGLGPRPGTGPGT
jgi:hypothetical protein